jgi:ribosomal protein S18 acetylase RimI-like enzyme
MTMTRESLGDLPVRFPLPPGITIRPMAGSTEAAAWTDVQRDAEPFLTIADDLFSREFGTDDAEIASRCLAAVDDATGQIVGLSSAWHGGDAGARGADWGRIHWVAVRPSYQRRGIARALVVECLFRLAELGHQRAYLVTSTGRHGAIALYHSLGFTTDSSDTA